MWCQFGRWKLVLTSNLKWREWKKSLYSTLKKKHWYYWKIVEEFLLKRTKFKHVDQLARDNSSLTLVKGCHLWLKSQKCFILGCIVYFYLFKASVSQNKRPQRFFPSRSLELLPAWAAILDSPWWATRRNRETVTSPQSMSDLHDHLVTLKHFIVRTAVWSSSTL